MKERLIGAAVLVGLGVWVIPWVLDGPDERADTPTAELRLPPAETAPPTRTETILLDVPAELRAEFDPDPAALAAPEAAPAPEGEPMSSIAEPVIAAADEAPSSPPAAEPDVESLPPAAEPATRDSPPAAQASPVEPPDEGHWMVQLGSFGDEENARRLAQRVATFGFSADVSAHRAGGRDMHRVRVGPQPSRQRAESVASSLAAHGFVAQVVPAGN